jgi:hypothetical protein
MASAVIFEQLVERYAGRPEVSGPEPGDRRFGSSALKVRGAIFAMEVQGRLVLKLPAARVGTLIEQGRGQPFSSGADRVTREWVSLPADDDTALTLAEEAYLFVRATAERNARSRSRKPKPGLPPPRR